MKLLRLATTLNSTSAPYNQFSLGLKSEVNQTFCSLFKNDIAVHSDIDAFNGEGSIFKMLRILKNLLYKNDFDVIHLHSGLTGIIFLISLFPFKLKLLRKTVFTLHNSWEVLKIRNQILDFIIMCLSEKVFNLLNNLSPTKIKHGVTIKVRIKEKIIPKTIAFDNCSHH